MVFADIRNPIAFQKIFSKNTLPEILLSALNSILHLPEGKQIISVNLIEIPNSIEENQKEWTINFKVEDQKKHIYLVELQFNFEKGIEKSILYSAAKTYASQILTSKDINKLEQVVFLGICDYTIFEGNDYYTKHLLLNTSTWKQDLKDFEFILVELPKYNLELEELVEHKDHWIYFLKNSTSLDKIPSGVDQGLKTAYEILDLNKWSSEERQSYDKWKKKS